MDAEVLSLLKFECRCDATDESTEAIRDKYLEKLWESSLDLFLSNANITYEELLAYGKEGKLPSTALVAIMSLCTSRYENPSATDTQILNMNPGFIAAVKRYEKLSDR